MSLSFKALTIWFRVLLRSWCICSVLTRTIMSFIMASLRGHSSCGSVAMPSVTITITVCSLAIFSMAFQSVCAGWKCDGSAGSPQRPARRSSRNSVWCRVMIIDELHAKYSKFCQILFRRDFHSDDYQPYINIPVMCFSCWPLHCWKVSSTNPGIIGRDTIQSCGYQVHSKVFSSSIPANRKVSRTIIDFVVLDAMPYRQTWLIVHDDTSGYEC